MSQSFANELRHAGISFDRYRDLARPIQDGQGAARWPLIGMTDQVLIAQRWKRQALAPQPPASNVTQLPSARPPSQPVQGSDWFLAESPPPAPTTSPGRSRAI